jgi:predicted transcriptional regulator
MSRVRLSADVDAELRRRVRIAAASSDRSVGEWIEAAVRHELEREESQTPPISRASAPAFGRDWDSEEDSVYDELADVG